MQKERIFQFLFSFYTQINNFEHSSGGEVNENNCAVPTRPIATDRKNNCTAQYNILMQTI